jgi:3-oxoacyl-[acyl-carrier-protein] synthase III
VTMGIVGTGIQLGEKRDPLADAAEYGADPRLLSWLGYRSYYRARPDQYAPELAADAVAKALAEAGSTPDDVDLMVVADTSMPEYLHWDTSLAIARRLGVTSMRTLPVDEGCVSAVVAFRMIAGLAAIEPDLRTVVLVAVNRASDAHSSRMGGQASINSDGAAAVVLRRDESRYRWITTYESADSRYNDFFRLEYGGAVSPYLPVTGPGDADDPQALVLEYCGGSRQAMAALGLEFERKKLEALQLACERVGRAPSDLERVYFLNEDARSLSRSCADLGIEPEHSNIALASRVGHCGAADHLLSLVTCVRRDELGADAMVALVGSSYGMRWACTLLGT